MASLNIKIDKKSDTYNKHHSFEFFHSNINADLEAQRQRAICALQGKQASPLGLDHEEKIAQAVLNDLLNPGAQSAFKMTTHIADEMSRIDDQYVRRYILHRYRYDIYPKQKMLDRYPPYLQIEPSSICNFRCVFCYQTDKDFAAKSSGHMGTMDFAMFKDIIDQIEGKVEFISLASRGEPFVCKDIDKMLDYCQGKFLGLKVNTNASLLNEAHCHALLSGGVNTVVFSADAAVEPLYSQLRVGGKLNKTLEKIALFKSIKDKQYSESKLISRVSGVKVNDAQDMSSMRKTWGELVDQLAFVTYNPWENVYQSPISGIDTPCSDLWRRMFVWYDGLVNPCDTDYKSTLAAGSFKESSISQIWRNEHYEHLRERHLKGERSCASPCQRCTVI